MSVTGLLLGHDRELTGYLVLVGVVLAVVAGIGIRRVPLGVSTVVWPTTQVEWLAVGAFVAVPAVVAAINDGVLLCWLIEFTLLFTIYVDALIASATDPLSAVLVTLVGSAATLAAIVAPLWGTIGFLVGAGGKRAGHRLRLAVS